MKREGQIRHKLKQVIYRHRKKFVEEGLAKRPCNCEYNDVVRLPLHTGNRATIHICQYEDDSEGWHNRVCDSSMGGDVQAKSCPYFECINTPESLKNEFGKTLGLGGEEIQTGVLAQKYPDVMALMWVLDTEQKNKKTPEFNQPNILAFFGSEGEPESVPVEPLLEDERGKS